MTKPYADAAATYRDAGWLDVLPLPERAKASPPAGFTGKRFMDVDPDEDQIVEWATERASGNICLRMPDNVIGIDVDNYGDKKGGQSLEAAMDKFGALPPTWRSTSREDGVSGIRLYRVPAGLEWPNGVGQGIDMVHRGHRYAVVWPSLHPEGRTYVWVRETPDGDVVQDGEVPEVDELPELPAKWVRGLTGGKKATAATRHMDADADEVQAAMVEWLPAVGTPCRRVVDRLQKALDELTIATSRHDSARDSVMGLIRLGQQGHAGAGVALRSLGSTFIREVLQDRGDERTVQFEWQSMVLGGISATLADLRPVEWCGGVACSYKLPSLALSAPESQFQPASGVFTQPGALPAPEGAPVASQVASGPGRHVRLTSLAGVTPKATRWLWDQRLGQGALAILSGREGIGKSTVAYWIAAQVTKGLLPGVYHGQPRDVVISATEDSFEHTIVPRLLGAGADLSRVWRVQTVYQFEEIAGEFVSEVELPHDTVELEQMVEQHGAALILLDPLMSRLDSKLDTHKDSEVRQALEPVTALAERTGSSVIGIMHLNKSGSGDPLTSMMGSRAFAAVARQVMSVVADEEDNSKRYFGVVKNNLGKVDDVALEFTLETKVVGADPDDGTPITTGAVVWGEKSTQSIRDLMQSQLGGPVDVEQKSMTTECRRWLREEYLIVKGVNGWVKTSDVKQDAEGMGFSAKVVRAALDKELPETKRQPGRGVVWWRGPKDATPPWETGALVTDESSCPPDPTCPPDGQHGQVESTCPERSGGAYGMGNMGKLSPPPGQVAHVAHPGDSPGAPGQVDWQQEQSASNSLQALGDLFSQPSKPRCPECASPVELEGTRCAKCVASA